MTRKISVLSQLSRCVFNMLVSVGGWGRHFTLMMIILHQPTTTTVWKANLARMEVVSRCMHKKDIAVVAAGSLSRGPRKETLREKLESVEPC